MQPHLQAVHHPHRHGAVRLPGHTLLPRRQNRRRPVHRHEVARRIRGQVAERAEHLDDGASFAARVDRFEPPTDGREATSCLHHLAAHHGRAGTTRRQVVGRQRHGVGPTGEVAQTDGRERHQVAAVGVTADVPPVVDRRGAVGRHVRCVIELTHRCHCCRAARTARTSLRETGARRRSPGKTPLLRLGGRILWAVARLTLSRRMRTGS